jgi:coenzyme F420-0:L-glutamate ligase/coenzyme F420-1:gamma-L-glutamate ligase
VSSLELFAVEGLPEVHPGDDLGDLISSRATLKAADVLVVAQKVVSKSEGKLRSLATVEASDEAKRIAAQLINLPDPRLVQVVLDESVRVLRSQRVTLLPDDPDASARRIRQRIHDSAGVDVGVIVSDTFGRPWRLGIVNVALGVAGLPALIDLRGTPDDAGRDMHATVLAIADDLASAAGLVMRKTARAPVIVIRGLELVGDGSGRDLMRPAAEDVFR